jgi:hypothetical protein
MEDAMGEGQFGGDGSVTWIITTERPFGGAAARTDGGIDRALNGGIFVVRLKVPTEKSGSQTEQEAFRLSGVLLTTADGPVVEFRMPIEDVARQIHVLWGQNNTVAS